MNQPLSAKSEMDAGTAQKRARIYSHAAETVDSEPPIMSRARLHIGRLMTRSNRLIDNAMASRRARVAMHSSVSPAPYFWAVTPLPDILRNEQLRYIMLKIVVPIVMPPIATSPPMKPAIAMSAIPMNGTVMFDIMFGSVRRAISLLSDLL